MNTEKKSGTMNGIHSSMTTRTNPLGFSFHENCSAYCCEPMEDDDKIEVSFYINSLEERPAPIGQDSTPLKGELKLDRRCSHGSRGFAL